MPKTTRSPRLATLALAALLAAGCATGESSEAPPPADQGTTELRDRFVGTWELVVYESFPEGRDPVDNDYIARITYDAFGNMNAVGMPRSLPGRAAEAAPGEMPRSGFAYFSTYELHEEEGYVVHDVIGSPMNPSWVGTELVRFYEFTDDGLLKLSLRNDAGRTTGTLTWRRLEAPATDRLE